MPLRSIRWLLLLFALGGGLLPAVATSQTSEEAESESHHSSPAKPSLGEEVPDLTQVAMRLTSLTNEFRQAEGHRVLNSNPQLADAARDFADFMARMGKYGHTADGTRPSAGRSNTATTTVSSPRTSPTSPAPRGSWLRSRPRGSSKGGSNRRDTARTCSTPPSQTRGWQWPTAVKPGITTQCRCSADQHPGGSNFNSPTRRAS
jgi:hypothetical protein